jgi:hypothetical protein
MSLDILLQRVACLGQTEHQEILNILACSGGISSTRNSNGVFIDLGTVPESLLEEIRTFVDYCHHNKKHIDDYNNRLVECRISQDFDRLPSYTHATPKNNDDDGNDITNLVTHEEETIVSMNQESTEFVSSKDRVADCEQSSYSRRSAAARFQQSKKRFNRRKGVNSISGYGGLLGPEPYMLNNKNDLCNNNTTETL